MVGSLHRAAERGGRRKPRRTLDPNPNATPQAKKAYQHKLKEVHPDKGGTPSQFQDLQRCVCTLRPTASPLVRLVAKS
jgi:hypothetical protein